MQKTIDQFFYLSIRTCVHPDLKENETYHTFSTIKGTS